MTNQKHLRSGRWVNRILRVVLLALVIYFCFFHFLSMPDPFFRRIVKRGLTAYSGTWQQTFEVGSPLPRLHVQTYVQSSTSQLHIDLEGENGLQLLKHFAIRKGHTRFSCGKDLPAGVYTVRIHEKNVAGKYVIEIGAEAALSWWQKFLIVLSCLLLLTGVLFGWQHRRSRAGRPAPALAGARVAFVCTLLAFFSLFLYLLLHEGGHALASISFGNFDLSRSDFFGLRGTPHSGINPEVQLEGWQRAIQSIGGPLLPTLVGYLLFAVWRCGWGTKIRTKKVIVDVFWSFAIFILLFAYFGLLIPMMGLRPDSDYSGFANHVRLARWQANAILLAMGLINAYMLYHVIPHLARLRKTFVKNLTGKNERE